MKLTRKSLHRARVVVAVLFWPLLALVVWASLIAFAVPPFNLGLSFQDLITHFSVYGALAAMASMAVHSRGNAIRALIGLIALGAMLEILQSFTSREASFLDAIANAAGVLCGGFLGRAIVEPLHRRYVLGSQGNRNKRQKSLGTARPERGTGKAPKFDAS
jgi:VanZ family protein